MLKGSIALVLRYVLLLGGSALATMGWIAQTGTTTFCFDTKSVAEYSATALVMLLGGGTSILGGIGWRFLAKARGGVT